MKEVVDERSRFQPYLDYMKLITENKVGVFLGRFPATSGQLGPKETVFSVLLVYLAIVVAFVPQVRTLYRECELLGYFGTSLVWTILFLFKKHRSMEKRVQNSEYQEDVKKLSGQTPLPRSAKKEQRLNDVRTALNCGQWIVAFPVVLVSFLSIAIALSYWRSIPVILCVMTTVVLLLEKPTEKLLVALLLALDHYEKEHAKSNKAFLAWSEFGYWVAKKDYPFLTPKKLVEVFPEYLEWKKSEKGKQ